MNSEEQKEPYQKLFTGNIGEQVTVFKRFQINMREREKILQKNEMENENPHVIPKGDPLYSYVYSNGFK